MTVATGAPRAPGFAPFRPGPVRPPAPRGVRWIAPAYSPLPPFAVVRACVDACVDACVPGRDGRDTLMRALRIALDAARAELYASGTQALAAAIRLAATRTRSSVVALPAYGCYDIGAAAVAADASIVPYDLDPASLAPDPESFDAAFRAGARAAVVAPLWGFPPCWDELRAIAARHDALLIEDAAQGVGSSWKGRVAGSIADIGVVSFGRGKGWSGGEGGALLLRGGIAPYAVPPRARSRPFASFKVALRVAAQAVFAHPALYGVPASIPSLHLGETRYRPCGTPRDISAFAAHAVRRGARAAQYESVVRRRNARVYDALLGVTGGRTMARPISVGEGAVPGYLRYPVRLLRDARTASTREAARAGVARGYPGLLTDVAPVAAAIQAGMRDRRWAGAEELVRHLVTLPTHSRATAEDRARALEIIIGAA